MDESGNNAEKIGCYFKQKVSNRADFYNGSFHLSDGIIENLMTNLTSDCFNSVEGSDFGCMHFYRIFSCFKVYVVRLTNEEKELSEMYNRCSPGGENKVPLKCVTKCMYEELKFYEGSNFNTLNAKLWMTEHLPPSLSKFFNDILQICFDKSIQRFESEPIFDCKYFYKYNSCLFVNVLKGLLDKAEHPPTVKGFKFDL